MKNASEQSPKETEIKALARIVNAGFERIDARLVKIDTRFDAVDTRFAALDKRIAGVENGLTGLSYKVDQLDAKLDQHRQETKDGFAGVHRLIGGISHTLTDHEERLKVLEGE